MKESLTARLTRRWFGKEIERQAQLSLRALDDRRDSLLSRPAAPPFERFDYDRQKTLEEALNAWRNDPLARRIVELTSQYVIGAGVSLEVEHAGTRRFLDEWWSHRLNRMELRLGEWCDELTRSGNLFVLVSTDAAGMSYVRSLPALSVQEIETAENDLEQELAVIEKPAAEGENPLQGRRWQVYRQDQDGRDEGGGFRTVALHYAINRPVGAVWGEPDLGPLLRWLGRYAAWLEDRVRLNRFRQVFLYWVKANFMNAGERMQRQAELNANPPNPGSILVTDTSEDWQVIQPRLDSFEAAQDGMALKKLIASGAGLPLHFLSEPESSTRSTAEAAGGPTFRRYQQRQSAFLWMLGDLLRMVVRRRAQVDPAVQAEARIHLKGSDIHSRDNAELAEAVHKMAEACLRLYEAGLIDRREALRMVYRFAGELVDVERLLEAAGVKQGGEHEN